jgi:2-haloacid dehalogenase
MAQDSKLNVTPMQGIQACVFDAYGTLFDYASAPERCRDALGDNLDALTRLWRDKQLQYAWLRDMQDRHANFWDVTGDALDFALGSLGIEDAVLRDRLMGLYLTLDAFPEVAETLGRLRAAGMKTAILSNGTPAMLQSAVRHAGLDGLLDVALSVEEVGVFKPHPKVYRLATERLGIEAASIAFVSSNGWDAHAAAAFGMRAVWCNRYGQRPELLPGAPEHNVQALTEFAMLVGA